MPDSPGDAAENTVRPAWAAAVVNHGSYEDLSRCLEGLEAQAHAPGAIVVWDTGVDSERLREVETRFTGARFLHGSNCGYAGGANRAIAAALSKGSEARPSMITPEFVLVMNPDVFLDPDFARQLIDSTRREPDLAIATGKLLREDRERLDSAGIHFPRHRRPRDRGSELLDEGQFDRRERVDAASGAAMLIRVDAIERLSLEGELFDEDFFAYHEDTDLCWRARRLGLGILYEPAAVAVHARGWQRERRSAIPAEIRRHSFKNHYLQIAKNESIGSLLVNAPWLLVWEVLRLGFVLLRDQAMLPAYGEAWRAMPRALRRRRILEERRRDLSGLG